MTVDEPAGNKEQQRPAGREAQRWHPAVRVLIRAMRDLV